MLFSSIPFLYYFLPIVLVLYFIAPWKLKNTVLLLSSLFFYGCGEPKYLILISISIMTGYIAGLLMGKSRTRGIKKIILAVSTAILAGFLVYFKYADFFITNFNALTGLSLPLLRVVLPIGISFYTFQILSYTVDVYRNAAGVQKNIINFAAYVTMFPQLIAGPIVRYTDVEKELVSRTITATKAYEGARRFIVGFSKKILIANSMAEIGDIFRASGDKSVLFYWMYAISFMLFVYFDFSGYSDMAIGLGKILGFEFPENFNYPFLSKSVTEFWRRWHMTLGTWFRDYVYIPLGGNRVPFLRWIFNIAVVWAFTGLWHGAAWNFVIWGVLFAVLLVAEKFFLTKWLNKIPKVFSHIYLLFIAAISFIIFNAANMSQAFSDIAGLFGAGGIPIVNETTLYYLRSYLVFIIIAVIGSTPVVKITAQKLRTSFNSDIISKTVEPIVMVGLLLICTAFLVDGSFNPFLYFRF